MQTDYDELVYITTREVITRRYLVEHKDDMTVAYLREHSLFAAEEMVEQEEIIDAE